MNAETFRKTGIKIVLTGAALLFLGVLVSCKQPDENSAAAESQCMQHASAATGYHPAKPSGPDSTVGKGAAVGAVGGAAVGAATAKKGKSSKKAVQGAAVGAAAGAGVAALSDKEKKKAAAQLKDAYQREYQSCLAEKGF